jgi:CRISPR-associated protein (TIGR03986 family)
MYHPDRWSGRISVKLTTKTPLLIPDIFDNEVEKHKTYPLRLDVDGKPYLPPTSIKGMLRSAYEAVTNSRLSVFEKHGDLLVYRMEAREIGLIPARVESSDNGTLKLRLMQAVKLPRYSPDKLLDYSSEVQDHKKPKLKSASIAQIPQHGEPVWVKYTEEKVVTKIQRRDLTSSNYPSPDCEKGWVWIANQNIKGKKKERVFVESDDGDIQIDANMKSMWEKLIQNYKKQHVKGLEKRKEAGIAYDAYLGDEPGRTAFSRHIYESDAEILKEGTLCYVELDNSGQVKALLPVTVSRHFYEKVPNELLHDTLKPSEDISKLSPADRVFGWVNQRGNGSYKGNLRIHSVQCKTDAAIAIQEFDPNLTLAILGQPKPQQARFYVAKDNQGTPLPDRIDKQDGYRNKAGGLRGRKIYPHHRNGAWDNPTEARNQEYRQDEPSEQNRSIKNWVKENTEFSFSIDVTNLSNIELGGLLWLLSLPKCHYHRLGGGKPLGFGSVRLEVDWDATDLRTGENWKEFYSSLDIVDNQDRDNAKDTINSFKKEVENIYGNGKSFPEVSFIKAFCLAATGFSDGKPIHYPRLTPKPDPKGKSFEWFVANERTGNQGGRQMSLPSLIDDRGLPYNPSK